MKRMKKKKFEAGVYLNILFVLVLSSLVLIGGIGSSVSTPPSVLEDENKVVLSVYLVPHPIFGTAEYETGGWAVGADVTVHTDDENVDPEDRTLYDTVGDSGEWQVDVGDPGADWPEGAEFSVLIEGTEEYTGWRGIAYGTVSGYYNDMGNIVVHTPGDLGCEGDLSWTDVKPGAKVTGSFKVKNIGTSGSLLDWEITEWPTWGEGWSFDPDEGEYLTPEASPYTVDVEVVAPDEQNQQFTGAIKIVNKENSSDFCTIDAELETPVNQPSSSSQLIQQFPILEQILSSSPFYNRLSNLQ